MTSELKLDQLQQNLKKLFVEGLHNDTVFRVENREFPVHKGILSVRSPVFASMFKYNMIENRSNAIDIPDCSAEAFELFLLYLYTGIIGEITHKNVFNLHYITDKYYVDELKKECLEFMKNNLSMDNFCEILEVSIKHSELEMLNLVIKFFFKNAKTLKATKKWQSFSQENPIIVSELLLQAVRSLKK